MPTPSKAPSSTSAVETSVEGKNKRNPRDTPAMRQFTRFKKQHPDCLLLFRMGDFYELFDDDAVTAHKVLGITLTQRTEGIPMAGVPYHSVEGYIRRLIAGGHRVAVCDQIQDPKDAKGVVDRAVTRVLTPGTLVDDVLLDESAANQVAAILFTDAGDDSNAVIAVAELSTGQFTLLDLPHHQVVDELARIAPSELLYAETADGNPPPRVQRIAEVVRCPLSPRPTWTFRLSDARDLLRTHYAVQTLGGFGLTDDDPALAPAGALLRYLQETQAPNSDPRQILAHLQPPTRRAIDRYLTLDATSLRALEIERTMRTGDTAGSLLSVLQRCVSPMGRRQLRQWICFPLRDAESITARQRCVAALVDDRPAANELRDQLGRIQDVPRIVARVSVGRATPRDLVALGRSVAKLDALGDLLDQRPAFAAYHKQMQQLTGVLRTLSDAITEQCIEEPPAHMREGGLFRDGVDAQLDEARHLQRDANSWLAAYQQQLSEELSLNAVKVGYNKVFGYYIELSHANRDKAPDSFTRKQTLKNAERYITPELKEFEDKVTSAESRAIERERHLFTRLCAQAAAAVSELNCFAQIVADLDVLGCFAELAVRYHYVPPTLVDEPVLEITQGRHPVLDQTLSQSFVPNDCVLGAADSGEAHGPTLALITGPNMAGKSTYIRQTALIVLLAHTGCSVPAESATIGLTDRIFTRIGASDELHTGQSTFMVEMTETANILHHATDRSLVVLDEIGRGTSTLDGLSLAWAIAESFAQRRCRTLFATHYHELTSLADRDPTITNLHVAVREWGEEIVFVYRILPGRTDRSYGIHVAKIAGMPPHTVQRANDLLDTLAVQTPSPHIPDDIPAASARRDATQMSLFTEYLPHPVMDELRGIDLNALTPMEAFDLLRGLRAKLEDGSTS
jgi:DNA mismatch repair protein MutS